MTRITLNDITDVRELSTEEQKAHQGGFGPFGFNPFFDPFAFNPWVMPSFNPWSPYANGYGANRNQFQFGSFGHGVQAATFAGQALNDQRHASFLANF